MGRDTRGLTPASRAAERASGGGPSASCTVPLQRVWLTQVDPEPRGRLSDVVSAGYPEFGQDGRDVVVDGPGRQDEAFGDVGVAEPAGQEPQDIDLTGAETGGAGGRCWAGSAADPAGAHVSELDGGQVRGGPGPQQLEDGQARLQMVLVAGVQQAHRLLVRAAEGFPG